MLQISGKIVTNRIHSCYYSVKVYPTLKFVLQADREYVVFMIRIFVAVKVVPDRQAHPGVEIPKCSRTQCGYVQVCLRSTAPADLTP